MSASTLTIPAPTGLVVRYLGGSRAFAGLYTEASDKDVFHVDGGNWISWLAALNLSYSDRGLLALWLPSANIQEDSPTWQALVEARDTLLTQPRLQRLLAVMAPRALRGTRQGKPLAEILRRCWQVQQLLRQEDPYALPADLLSLLVALQTSPSNEQTEQAQAWLQAVGQAFQAPNLDGFSADDSTVVTS